MQFFLTNYPPDRLTMTCLSIPFSSFALRAIFSSKFIGDVSFYSSPSSLLRAANYLFLKISSLEGANYLSCTPPLSFIKFGSARPLSLPMITLLSPAKVVSYFKNSTSLLFGLIGGTTTKVFRV
jgi:hypothetical protein